MLAAFAPRNLVTGNGGRTDVQPDLAKLNLVRVIYGSEGGVGEAYYAYDGRVWARWETDFPGGEDNLAHRLPQLTRINVNPTAASRFLTAPDLGDFPIRYMSIRGGWSLPTPRRHHYGVRDFLDEVLHGRRQCDRLCDDALTADDEAWHPE